MIAASKEDDARRKAAMEYEASRTGHEALHEVQRGNRSRWSDHAMIYDWHGEIDLEPETWSWFGRW
jgi:hypothetical protein